MDAGKHAKRLGLFAYVYAGMLTLVTVASATLFLNTFLPTLKGSSVPTFEEIFSTWRSPYTQMFYVFVVLIIISLFFISSTVIANVRLGWKLRGGTRPTRRLVIVASVLSVVTSLFGGLLLIPFGCGLAGYGIWFAISQGGSEYLAAGT